MQVYICHWLFPLSRGRTSAWILCLVYGIIPRGPMDLSTLPDRSRLHGDATVFVDSIADVHAQAITNLESSSSKYKQAADLHHRRLVFEVDNLVWAYITRDKMPARDYNKLK